MLITFSRSEPALGYYHRNLQAALGLVSALPA
jgi:hypothetical protein